MAHISLLGCGTWGSTLAQVLGQNGHSVTAWHYKADMVEDMTRTRTHPNISDFEFHSNIIFINFISYYHFFAISPNNFHQNHLKRLYLMIA